LEILVMQDRFAMVLSASDVERAKPAPDLYLLAAERLGLKPARCFAIEDSAAGVAAARAAGCPVIGFTGFNVTKTPLEGAALMINQWHELTYERLRALVA
jgi:beta-phosphoglucomutase-like phosphatase (HAD superfamily)